MAAPEIFRELRYRPRVVAELLADVSGVALPKYDAATAESLDGGDADDKSPLVVVLRRGGEPQRAIVVDALDSCESPARLMWPQWAAAVAARLAVEVHSLVMTSEDVVEHWARQAVHLDEGRVFEPHVIGPSAIPSDGNRTPALVLMNIARRMLPRA